MHNFGLEHIKRKSNRNRRWLLEKAVSSEIKGNGESDSCNKTPDRGETGQKIFDLIEIASWKIYEYYDESAAAAAAGTRRIWAQFSASTSL